MTRSNLLAHVSENPGVHFNALVRELDVTPDKLQRLTRDLEADGELVAEQLYGKTHFYTDAHDEWERRALALIRRETSREILFYLLEVERARPDDVTDHVGIARSTLEWHCERLVDAGLVEKRRDGRTVELVVVTPDEIRELLSSIRPGLPERWIDRTTRLFDQLFEDAHRSGR